MTPRQVVSPFDFIKVTILVISNSLQVEKRSLIGCRFLKSARLPDVRMSLALTARARANEIGNMDLSSIGVLNAWGRVGGCCLIS